MKNRNLITIVSALFVAGLLTSCDIFDKADDVSFNASFDESFTITNAPAGTLEKSIVVDATTDPEVNKYKEKITSIVINEITYKVTDYDGPSTATFSGDAVFGTSSDTDAFGSVEISSLNLSNASSTGQEFQLSLAQTEVDAIAAQLKNNSTVTVTFAGTLSEGPASFKIQVKVDATIEADAL